MQPNFLTIQYLATGNTKQQQVYALLSSNSIMELLQPYDPILTGTIPINIYIDSSDLDIICCYKDVTEFKTNLQTHFSKYDQFSIKEMYKQDVLTITANFYINKNEIELFGQPIPTKEQMAYKHMLIEYALLEKHGEAFRQQVIKLKQQGYKTEPAFALLLGLNGDPYIELLNY